MKNVSQETTGLIERLQLQRHPEGGWYRETYRAEDTISARGLPPRFAGDRSASTAIYFLLAAGDFSALHRLRSDEMWHFYTGIPLSIHCLTEGGDYTCIRLGSNLDRGETFQAVVPAGNWFGATLDEETGYALVGCTVAPGFDFADFAMAKRNDLLLRYPQHAELIEKLTRS